MKEADFEDEDATQQLSIAVERNDDDDAVVADDENVKVADLIIKSSNLQCPKSYAIYEGDNIIGRHENADVHIPVKCISKKHARIETGSGEHFICDFGSKNGTRRGKTILRKNVMYELLDGCELTFGGVKCKYKFCCNEQRKKSNPYVSEDIAAPNTDSDCDTEASEVVPCSKYIVQETPDIASSRKSKMERIRSEKSHTEEHFNDDQMLFLQESENSNSTIDDELPSLNAIQRNTDILKDTDLNRSKDTKINDENRNNYNDNAIMATQAYGIVDSQTDKNEGIIERGKGKFHDDGSGDSDDTDIEEKSMLKSNSFTENDLLAIEDTVLINNTVPYDDSVCEDDSVPKNDSSLVDHAIPVEDTLPKDDEKHQDKKVQDHATLLINETLPDDDNMSINDSDFEDHDFHTTKTVAECSIVPPNDEKLKRKDLLAETAQNSKIVDESDNSFCIDFVSTQQMDYSAETIETRDKNQDNHSNDGNGDYDDAATQAYVFEDKPSSSPEEAECCSPPKKLLQPPTTGEAATPSSFIDFENATQAYGVNEIRALNKQSKKEPRKSRREKVTEKEEEASINLTLAASTDKYLEQNINDDVGYDYDDVDTQAYVFVDKFPSKTAATECGSPTQQLLPSSTSETAEMSSSLIDCENATQAYGVNEVRAVSRRRKKEPQKSRETKRASRNEDNSSKKLMLTGMTNKMIEKDEHPNDSNNAYGDYDDVATQAYVFADKSSSNPTTIERSSPSRQLLHTPTSDTAEASTCIDYENATQAYGVNEVKPVSRKSQKELPKSRRRTKARTKENSPKELMLSGLADKNSKQGEHPNDNSNNAYADYDDVATQAYVFADKSSSNPTTIERSSPSRQLLHTPTSAQASTCIDYENATQAYGVNEAKPVSRKKLPKSTRRTKASRKGKSPPEELMPSGLTKKSKQDGHPEDNINHCYGDYDDVNTQDYALADKSLSNSTTVECDSPARHSLQQSAPETTAETSSPFIDCKISPSANGVDEARAVQNKRNKKEPPKSKKLKKDTKSEENSPIKLMFTGLTDKKLEQWAKNLDIQLTDCVYDATHLVTDKVRRTVKLLCCLSRGIKIVNFHWLEACHKAKKIISDDDFVLEDKQSEKQFDFKLRRSLELSRQKQLINGYSVYVTKNVQPSPKQMKDIIQCAGGKAISKVPKKVDEKTLIISSEEEKGEVKKLTDIGWSIYSAELLLSGILQQQLIFDKFKLNSDPTPITKNSKRSRSSADVKIPEKSSKRRRK